MCMTTLKRSFIRKDSLTLDLRKQPFRGVLLSRYSSIVQINHINLLFEAAFLEAHPNFPNPFQIYKQNNLGNFVLLKDSYDSLTFDSHDLIPTLETVYGK